MSGGLIKYDAARRALAEAHRVDEVKDIRDKAVAMQAYARQAKDTSLITQATEIRLRAERQAGELLRGLDKNQGAIPGKTGRKAKPVLDNRPKLADLGINKTQSSRWQALAALDDDQFEAKVETTSKRAYQAMTHRFLKADKIARAKTEHARRTQHGCTVDNLVALAASGKRFGVIHADPAWPWETWCPTGKVHSCENHYGTSTIDAIMKLPVAALAADDCALFLWCTGPHIAIGTHAKVIAAWGFGPSTLDFVWIKTTPAASVITPDGSHHCPRWVRTSSASVAASNERSGNVGGLGGASINAPLLAQFLKLLIWSQERTTKNCGAMRA